MCGVCVCVCVLAQAGVQLTWGLDQLFIYSQERRLRLLTALAQRNHLQQRDELINPGHT